MIWLCCKSYTNNLKKACLKARWFDLQFDYNSFFDILLEVWNYLNRFASIGEKNAENTRNKKKPG